MKKSSTNNEQGPEEHMTEDQNMSTAKAPASEDDDKGTALGPLFVVLLGAFILAFYVALELGSGDLVHKQVIKTRISKAIVNGADLRAVKQIYNNRPIQGGAIRGLFHGVRYYKVEVALSTILEDIRADVFLSDEEAINKGILEPLNEIIKEHSTTNPFDRLESAQKDDFETIRTKLADAYAIIETDINKIADKLYNKNTLVSKYLRDSQRSFYISIAAFVLSVVMATITLYQNWKNRVQLYRLRRITLPSHISEPPGTSEGS